MRILVIVHHYLQISETFIFNQLKSIESNNIHIAFCEKINEKNYPINAYEFKYNSKPVNLADRLLSFFYRRKNRIKRYSFSYFTYLRFKNYIRKNKIEIIYAQYGPNAIKVFPFKKYLGLPVVAIVHGYDGSALLNNTYYLHDLRISSGFFNHIIFVSEKLKNNFIDNQIKITKYTILPCGVDMKVFQKSIGQKRKDTITLLHLGRLVSKKGVPDLVDAVIPLLVKYKNVKLKIAGDGPDHSILIDKIEKVDTGIRKNIELIGTVNHKEAYDLFNESDIFILNSRIAPDGDIEGTPVSLLEAMSMELGIVTTKHGNIPDLIQHGYNGLLVPEKNTMELTLAMETLITNPEKRAYFGKNARQSIMNNYNIHVVNEQLCQILSEAIS